MNSDSFINNTDCKYFPCHKTAHPEDFNNFTYTERGIKNCTDCMVPHSRNAVQYIISRWPEIAEVARKKD